MGKSRNGTRHEREYESPSATRTLTQSISSQLREKIGTMIGPECLVCHEPIDTRSTARNHTARGGNVTQGWVHDGCRQLWANTAAEQVAA